MSSLITRCALLVVLLLTACDQQREEPSAARAVPQRMDPRVPVAVSEQDVLRYLGPRLSAILAAPDKLTVHRIDSELRPNDVMPNIKGYRIIRSVEQLPEGLQQSWSAMTRNPDAFENLHYPHSSRAKGCAYRPGLALEFTRENAKCFVLICYSCADWEFYSPAEPDTRRKQSFEPKADAMRQLAQATFPDDSAFLPR